VVNKVANEAPKDTSANLIHFGESILSMRTLLKRFCLHEAILLKPLTEVTLDSVGTTYAIQRKHFPHHVGYVADAGSIGRTINGAEFLDGNTTFLHYVTSAFAGWRGGVRYVLDSTSVNDGSSDSKITWVLGRLEQVSNNNCFNRAFVEEYDSEIMTTLVQRHTGVSGLSGSSRWNTHVNPQHTFELPYYSAKRFKPARKNLVVGDSADNFAWKCVGTRSPTDQAAILFTHAAAAEDFTPVFFVGIPIMYQYLTSSLPTGSPEQKQENSPQSGRGPFWKSRK
jgi:hypothetical protein